MTSVIAPQHDAVVATSKKIVLFADGTGNAFSSQESNVWRLYSALDVSRPEQIAHYIPGVGTSKFRPWAMLDGATGFGVPANVRALYEFLCWNYAPGDQIFMFGFSRGAFTIRSLIGMIDKVGLLTWERSRIPSRPEMRRNVMAAWRRYRQNGNRRSLANEAPTIKITRWLRDAGLWLKERISGQTPTTEADHSIEIQFAGLFDTVEAYGVPIEEMRDAIDWAIWPIKFSNTYMSKKVRMARHALSLDDERQTFRPIRINLADEGEFQTSRIKEVWFSGVHSDVGGGYPDDGAALVALDWMIKELGPALTFREGAVADVTNGASAFATIHDSRSGLGVLYRYAPRIITSNKADGGAPTVHYSVLVKMAFGADRYAPHSLPAKVQVLKPDGTRTQIEGFADDRRRTRREDLDRAEVKGKKADELADEAIACLQEPRKDYVESLRARVWLRRKAYFLLLICLFLIVIFPVFDTPTLDVEDNISGFVRLIATALNPIIPGYAHPWVTAAIDHSIRFGVLLLATVLLYCLSNHLRDAIADDARCAWLAPKTHPPPVKSWIVEFASAVRNKVAQSSRPNVLSGLVTACFVAVFALCALFIIDRSALAVRVASGGVCEKGAERSNPLEFNSPVVRSGFKTSMPCWDTGVEVEKGRIYRISLEMTQPFLDRSRASDIQGLPFGSVPHTLFAPFKRWWTAPYFAPVARIEPRGLTEWVLEPEDGQRLLRQTLPEKYEHIGEETGKSPCDPIKPDLSVVKTLQQDLKLHTNLVSRFTAKRTGRLFLYVNDVMLGLVPSDCFYRNNGGEAKMSIELLPPSTPMSAP